MRGKYFRKRKKKGFSLVEILISMALFALLATALSSFAIDSIRASQNAKRRLEASLYLQELYNAIYTKKLDSWASLIPNTDAGPKHLNLNNYTYQFADGSTARNGITLSIEVKNLYRDAFGNIQPGGTLDINSRIVNITASWHDLSGQLQTITSKLYVNNWNIMRWIQTTQADFDAGTHNATVVENLSGGEVKLETIVYADWCNPALTAINYDLAGQGVASSITAIPGRIFTGTGGNASGTSYAQLGVTQTNAPTVTTEGTYNGGKTNAVFGETISSNSYAYIATDTNSSEVDILDTTSTPYTKIGYFDAPGNGNGAAIITTTVNSSQIGLMTSGSKLYAFDLSAKTGSRPVLNPSGLTLSGTGRKIAVNDNYAYVVTSSISTQLQIIDISNPANPVIVGTASDNNAGGGIDVFINTTATRAYLLTSLSSTRPEFHIFDITNKTGPHSPITNQTYNITDNMSPKGLTIVGDEGRAIIVGTSGTQQYQVLDLTSTNPTKCGGIAVTGGINGISSVVDSIGNAYSYVATNDSSREIMLIKGGPGGGFGGGLGYATNGTFLSQVFDTQAAIPSYVSIEWFQQLPANTTLRIQVRSADTVAAIASAEWYGPSSGSGDTGLNKYYDNPSGGYISPSFPQKRYFQFQVLMESDTQSTPTLVSVTLNYQQ